MEIFLSGAEQPTALKQLISFGATHAAISYFAWSQRHTTSQLFKILPHDMAVCVTAGVSRKDLGAEWENFCSDYISFCAANAEYALIYDLDAPACPIKLRRQVQHELDQLPNSVIFPVEGESLSEIAQKYERIGVNSRLVKSMPVAELRRVEATLYGSNVLDHRVLRPARFVATTTTAWLSPQRFGELWVFNGTKLVHHRAAELARGVRLHRATIERLGVDAAKAAANDKDALTEIAVKSLKLYAEDGGRRRRDLPDSSLVTSSDEVVNERLPITLPVPDTPSHQRERITLPVMHIDEGADLPQVSSENVSFRVCDTCYLSSACPAYSHSSSCAFKMPVQFRTDAQVDAACESILEMQYGRVAFAHFGEQIEGQGIQPRVGQEMDRFYKLLALLKEIKTPIPNPGGGVLSRAFGSLRQPEETDEVGEEGLSGQEGNEEGEDGPSSARDSRATRFSEPWTADDEAGAGDDDEEDEPDQEAGEE